MGSYRAFGMIRTKIWQSERFTSVAAADARLAYFWMHTSYKTSAGVLRIGPYHLLEEVDLVQDLARAEAIFEELAKADLIVVHRPFVVITKFLKANPVKSWKHAVGALGDILELPEGELRNALMDELIQHVGTRQLVDWRDKSGEPHPLVHVINAYLLEKDEDWSELYPNPSNSLYEGNGSGFSKKENNKEKKEHRTDNGATSGQSIGSTESFDKTYDYKSMGPRPETVLLAKKMAGG